MSTLTRIVRLVCVAIAAVVALALTAYLTVNLVGLVSATAKRAELSTQLTARIATEVPASQERAQEFASDIDAPPTHHWVAQQCGFSTDDAGWMVQNYRQVCSLESVHVWKVATEGEARTLLGDHVQTGTRPFTIDACQRYQVADSLGAQDAFSDSQLALTYLGPAAEGSRWCEPTDRGYQQRRSVVGEIPVLDDTQGWLVAVQSDKLVDEDLGCLHWSVIFCDNPFGNAPAWGRPPG